MNEPTKWLRHWTSAPHADGRQLCVSCGKVLVDPAHTRPAPRYFLRSAPLYERGTFPVVFATAISERDTFTWCTTLEVAPVEVKPRHSARCIERHLAADLERARFRNQWPKACSACGARGIVATSDVETLSEVPQDCASCLGAFTCPRCAASLVCNPMPQPCASCGWTIGEPGEPPFPGCIGCGAAEVSHA